MPEDEELRICLFRYRDCLFASLFHLGERLCRVTALLGETFFAGKDMLLVSGPGLAGYLNYYWLKDLPWPLLHNICGTSGGCFAVVSACARVDIKECLSEIYTPSAFLDFVRLSGSAHRLEVYKRWLQRVTGDSEVTFCTWSCTHRRSFRLIAFDCENLQPVIFSCVATPHLKIADALVAATAWPSVTDCHQINSVKHCDVEYTISPHLIGQYVSPRPLLLLRATMQSMEHACAKLHSSAEKWCATFEHYGTFTEYLGQLASRSPPLLPSIRIVGPHLFDTMLVPAETSLAAYLPSLLPAREPLVVALVLASVVTLHLFHSRGPSQKREAAVLPTHPPIAGLSFT